MLDNLLELAVYVTGLSFLVADKKNVSSTLITQHLIFPAAIKCDRKTMLCRY